jgi:hypothetical protein
LEVACRILGVCHTGSSAENRAGRRPDAGAPTAADCGADRRSETGAEKGAADGLRVGLVAQRGDLRIGVLPANLIVIIGLRQSRSAHRERRRNRADKLRTERHHREILLHTVIRPDR